MASKKTKKARKRAVTAQDVLTALGAPEGGPIADRFAAWARKNLSRYGHSPGCHCHPCHDARVVLRTCGHPVGGPDGDD